MCKKIVLFIIIGHTRVALKLKKTNLTLETSSEINFEFVKFVNHLPLTNQIGYIKYLVFFDNFLLPNQLDLSVDRSYHFSTSYFHRLRCNNKLVFLIKFQTWQFDEKLAFQN